MLLKPLLELISCHVVQCITYINHHLFNMRVTVIIHGILLSGKHVAAYTVDCVRECTVYFTRLEWEEWYTSVVLLKQTAVQIGK